MGIAGTKSWWTIAPPPSRFGWFQKRWKAAAILLALTAAQVLGIAAWIPTVGSGSPLFWYLGSTLFLLWWVVPIGFIVVREVRAARRDRRGAIWPIIRASAVALGAGLLLGGVHFATFWMFFVAWIVGLFYFP